MKKSIKTTLGLAILLCGMGMATAKAQSSTSTTTTSTSTSTTTVSDDGATGTDPVPLKPHVYDIVLMVLQAIM